MAFLLMLGIQARIIPWTIENNIGVDAKLDFSFKVTVGSKVKQVQNIQKKMAIKYSKKNSIT